MNVPGPHRVIEKLFSNTRYFVIKSNNHENVDIAKMRVSDNFQFLRMIEHVHVELKYMYMLMYCIVPKRSWSHIEARVNKASH